MGGPQRSPWAAPEYPSSRELSQKKEGAELPLSPAFPDHILPTTANLKAYEPKHDK